MSQGLKAYGNRLEQLPRDEQLRPDGHNFGKGRQQMRVARSPRDFPNRGEREERDDSERARLHQFICVRFSLKLCPMAPCRRTG